MKLPEITLDWLRKKDACVAGYKYCDKIKITDPIALIQRLIDDEHYDWANWLIVRLMARQQRIAYAIYAAELVLPIFEKKYPDDLRPRKAIEAARRFLACGNHKNKIISANSAYAAAAATAAYAAAAAAYAAAAYAAAAAAYAAAAAAYAAAAAAYAAATTAADSKIKKETYRKILAYGIELLTKEN